MWGSNSLFHHLCKWVSCVGLSSSLMPFSFLPNIVELAWPFGGKKKNSHCSICFGGKLFFFFFFVTFSTIKTRQHKTFSIKYGKQAQLSRHRFFQTINFPL
jgi:hypothetical protein